jgi:hypothetical protein
MEEWGYVLIASGIVWVFAKFLLDAIVALRSKGAGEVRGFGAGVDPEALAKLVATPYGPGISLALLGVVLVLAANGFSVNVGSTTPPPTPAPVSTEPFPFPLPTLPTPVP